MSDSNIRQIRRFPAELWDIQRDRSTDWRAHSNCVGQSTLFFSLPFERPEARVKRERKALALCADCEVCGPCREFARQNGEYGVWGAENEADRVRAGVTLVAATGVARRRGHPGTGPVPDFRKDLQ
jgi:WhiB family transcriptional regulator, redox-sensing transcriptional regulator